MNCNVLAVGNWILTDCRTSVSQNGLKCVSISCRVKDLIQHRAAFPVCPSRADKVKHWLGFIYIHKHTQKMNLPRDFLRVMLQAVLDFHRQVGIVMDHVLHQLTALFGTTCKLSEECSEQQVMVQLMGVLNESGRYFAVKEKMQVRWSTTSLIDYEFVLLLLACHC